MTKTARFFLSERKEKINRKKARAFIVDFCQQNGITLSKREKGPVYINHDLSEYLLEKASIRSTDTLSFIIHELAHFVVANEEERRSINYGLGKGIFCDYGNSQSEEKEWLDQFCASSFCHTDKGRQESFKEIDQIEGHAILLHALIAKRFGFCTIHIFDEFNLFINTFDKESQIVTKLISEIKRKNYQVKGLAIDL